MSVVLCQWSVVSCLILQPRGGIIAFDHRRRRIGLSRPDGPQVSVESRSEFIQHAFQEANLFFGEKLSPKRPAKPMLRFMERAAGHADEPAVVVVTPPPCSLRDVGPNTV